MPNELYSHDAKGRLILAGEPHLNALAIAKEKEREQERWWAYNRGLPFYRDTTNIANPEPPEPNERPAAKELNALWEDITRIREELRKMREDMRGLTQALVNTRKEANLARGGGVKQPANRSALEG